MKTSAWLRLLVAVYICLSGAASAHEKSLSYSEWSLRSSAELSARVTLSARQATLLLGEAGAPTDPLKAAMRAFERGLTVTNDGEPCPATAAARPVSAATGSLSIELSFRCPAPIAATLRIRNDAFFDLSAGHLHFARFVDGRGFREAALSADARRFAPFGADEAAAARSEAGPSAFLLSGVRHILAGPDHLAFVFGVLLAAATPRQAIWAITGFTVGHSLSLAAAIGGVVAVEGRLIEALIAFTIWLVAVEIVIRIRRPEARLVRIAAIGLIVAAATPLIVLGGHSLLFGLGLTLMSAAYLRLCEQAGHDGRVLLGATTLFGLLHGFGFAGALQQAFSDGMGLGVRLLAFNIGVEIGQVAFITALAALVWALARLFPAEDWREQGRFASALTLCALGAFWFVERAIAT